VPVLLRRQSTTNRFQNSQTIKIIGVGGAGLAILTELKTMGVVSGLGFAPQWIYIDQGLWQAHSAVRLDRAEVVTLSLSPRGSSESAKLARAVAWDHEYLLRPMLASTGVVVLIAGLGGSVGSGMAPVLARMALDAGSLILAVAVTPFDFERRRNQRIAEALKRLHRSTEFVFKFSNQELAHELGDDILMEHFFAIQTQRIAICIKKFLTSIWLS
jgi:cell division protein FtsZ